MKIKWWQYMDNSKPFNSKLSWIVMSRAADKKTSKTISCFQKPFETNMELVKNVLYYTEILLIYKLLLYLYCHNTQLLLNSHQLKKK